MARVPAVLTPRVAVVAAAVAAAIIPLPAHWIEDVYWERLYGRAQPVVSSFSAALPVPPLDGAAAVLLVLALGATWRRWRTSGAGGALRWAARTLLFVAAAGYLWFVLLWGLNYRRVPLEHKLAYHEERITRESALAFARHAIERANSERPRSAALSDDALRDALQHVLRGLGGTRPTAATSPRRSLLQLYFRYAAIDGMTDPFFLTVILHPDLLPSERPFVLAHEWAHLAGYADESEANFIAWLACIRAAGAGERYSGWLAAYQHVASALPPADQRTLAGRLTPPVAQDVQAERARLARSSTLVRTAARDAYDTYLRANRIDEGVANYGAVVRLMLGTRFDPAWLPQLR